MIKDPEILKIDDSIKEKYLSYRELFSQISILTNEIKELEEKRINIIEKDGRRLLFKRPAIHIQSFNSWIKETKWCNVSYENFEEFNKDYITDKAMIVSVYCNQSNYMSPVDFILSLEGYLSKEEYEHIKLSNPKLPDYYLNGSGDNDGRTKI